MLFLYQKITKKPLFMTNEDHHRTLQLNTMQILTYHMKSIPHTCIYITATASTDQENHHVDDKLKRLLELEY